MIRNLEERYNVFLINKRSKGIVNELIYTNDLLNELFLTNIKKFKNMIISSSKSDFVKYIKEQGINSRKLVFCLLYFFDLKFKKILFPFYFKFELIRCDGFITGKTKFYEILLNLYLFVI